MLFFQTLMPMISAPKAYHSTIKTLYFASKLDCQHYALTNSHLFGCQLPERMRFVIIVHRCTRAHTHEHRRPHSTRLNTQDLFLLTRFALRKHCLFYVFHFRAQKPLIEQREAILMSYCVGDLSRLLNPNAADPNDVQPNYASTGRYVGAYVRAIESLPQFERYTWTCVLEWI